MQVQALGATEATLQEIADEAEAVVLLRRIVKLLESSAVVDAGQRQRIAVDAMTSGLTLSTVSTVSALTAVAGMNQEMYINQARIAYATGIRAKLT